ncbi:MAG: dockerin type I repeat-containing protein [Clostridium sp.]|nr:dockerin type I repeat-containing protein [Clostridium sp.]
MKHLKKIAVLLTVAAMSAVSTVSAFAESGNILDIRDNLVLTISNETTNGGSNELWIDNSYRYLIAKIYKQKAAVRMTDGTVPPSAGEGKEQYVKKLTNVQKANLLSVETAWFIDTDIKLADDLYIVEGFVSADETEKYCQQLIEEGKADYAQPIVAGTYFYCYPAGDLFNYFNGIEYDYDTAKSDEIAAFSEDLLIFSMNCKDESSTIEFLNENVEGFEERVYAAVECDSKIYFQLKNEAEEADNVKVLEQLSALENFTAPFVVKYAALTGDNPELQINSIPDKYKSGDVNMDENIDLYDAIRIAESMANIKTLTDVEFVLADIDGNDKVDLYDAIEVAKIMINK